MNLPLIKAIGPLTLERVHSMLAQVPVLFSCRDLRGQRWLALQEDLDPCASYWLWVPLAENTWRALYDGDLYLDAAILDAVAKGLAIRAVIALNGEVEDEAVCRPETLSEEILPSMPLPNPDGVDPLTGRSLQRLPRAGLATLLAAAKTIGQTTRR